MFEKSIYALLLAVATIAFPAAAQAAERDCVGAFGTEIADDVRVPAGASCVMSATRVNGTIKVEAGATLRASGIAAGSVSAKSAAEVAVTDSTVTGDIRYEQNTGPLTVSRNRVGKNVRVVGNSAGASIFSNSIGRNLQCKDNAQSPVGGDNLVLGNAEDQCVSFAGGAGANGPRPDVPGPNPGALDLAAAPRALPLLSPFPVVRIVGRATTRGARIRLLSVSAPPGASVTVICSGRGCPFRRVRRKVSTSILDGRRRPATPMRIRRLEGHILRRRAILRVLVTAPGAIGKYTRFRIRARRMPVRTDTCALPGRRAPLVCPSPAA